MTHKAGFVNIIGNPNVGKSTIMNLLVGEQLSIITSKAQTTRHRIMGIVNHKNYQIIYSDTPGILNPKYKLQETMMRSVNTALIDADIILYITDTVETTTKNQNYIDKIKKTNLPILLVINKIDLSDQQKITQLIQKWQTLLPQAEIYATSAKHKFNIDGLLEKIIEHLPERPSYFPKNQLTDKPTRFFISEIIREKILLNYYEEIPYSVEITIDEYKELPHITNINATIYVARESQKSIIIGKQGKPLKKLGTQARIDIENFLQKKVFLQLYVKTNENWRENSNQLNKFGYI